MNLCENPADIGRVELPRSDRPDLVYPLRGRSLHRAEG